MLFRSYWKQEREDSTAYLAPILHPAVCQFVDGAFVDVNLQRADAPGWMAHRANDAAMCTDLSEDSILEYMTKCAREGNALLVPFGGAAPVMALVTTRAVQAGDEILMPRGPSWWATSMTTSDSPASWTWS